MPNQRPKTQPPLKRNTEGQPLSTGNMAAEMEGGTTLAIPAGLTHDEAVAYVRRFNQNPILQFVQFS